MKTLSSPKRLKRFVVYVDTKKTLSCICTSKTWHADWDSSEKRMARCMSCGIELSNILQICLSTEVWKTETRMFQVFATCGDGGNPHDYYIPENIFYRLCMKAKNEVAEAFQAKVADEIIPAIRKTGSYSVTTPALPDFTNPAEAARAWATEYEQRVTAQKALSA